MIMLTPKQHRFLQIIVKNPGIRFPEIFTHANLPYKAKAGTGILKSLIHKELIRREGTRMSYRYYRTEVPYEVSVDADQQKIPRGPDLLLEKALAVQLTDEQLLYLNNQKKHMTRTQLAKKLGISKLELNLYLDISKAKK